MIKILLTFLLFCPSTYANPGDKDIIVWNKQSTLSWNDFRGRPDKTGEHIAMSKCGITMEQSSYSLPYGKPVYSFYAYFVPQSSWYYPQKVTQETLAHEQLHFDIAELFARKLRAQFDRVQIAPNEAKEIFDNTYKAYRQMQELYDSETRNGNLEPEQKKWRSKIGLALKKLSSYEQVN